MMEVYESHLDGAIYFDSRVLKFRDLHCEACGDCDSHLGHTDTWAEVLKLIDATFYSEEYLEKLRREFEHESE